MSKKTMKDRLLQLTEVICEHIKIGGAISRYSLGDSFNIQITLGARQKLKLVCSKTEIVGVRGFRETGERSSVDIPKKHWERAWRSVPEDDRKIITEFLSGSENKISVKCYYMVTYKGIPVGQMLNQGVGAKGLSFPRELGNNRFNDQKAANRAAIRLAAYIKGLQNKKGNNNNF